MGFMKFELVPLIAAEIHAGISCHTHRPMRPIMMIGHIDIGAHLFYFCSLYAAYDGGRGYCKSVLASFLGTVIGHPKIELEVNPRGLLFRRSFWSLQSAKWATYATELSLNVSVRLSPKGG